MEIQHTRFSSQRKYRVATYEYVIHIYFYKFSKYIQLTSPIDSPLSPSNPKLNPFFTNFHSININRPQYSLHCARIESRLQPQFGSMRPDFCSGSLLEFASLSSQKLGAVAVCWPPTTPNPYIMPVVCVRRNGCRLGSLSPPIVRRDWLRWFGSPKSLLSRFVFFLFTVFLLLWQPSGALFS